MVPFYSETTVWRHGSSVHHGRITKIVCQASIFWRADNRSSKLEHTARGSKSGTLAPSIPKLRRLQDPVFLLVAEQKNTPFLSTDSAATSGWKQNDDWLIDATTRQVSHVSPKKSLMTTVHFRCPPMSPSSTLTPRIRTRPPWHDPVSLSCSMFACSRTLSSDFGGAPIAVNTPGYQPLGGSRERIASVSGSIATAPSAKVSFTWYFST